MQVGAPLLDSVRFPSTTSININKMHHLSLTHQCKDTDNKLYNPLRNLSECLSQVERYLKALSGLNKLQSFEISRLLVAILIKIIFALVHCNEGLLGMFQVERYLEALSGL